MTEISITVGKDYSATPGGRYVAHGERSGEHFRQTVLIPALKRYDRVEVFLDGVVGYAGSFLEEAFGGLIRREGFRYEDLQKKLEVAVRDARYEIYRRMVEQYLKDAADAAAANQVA